MLLLAPLTGTLILSHSLASMVLYVWARRNQHVRMSLFGLFTFNAPYFPWVMLGLSVLLGSSPMRDLLGIGTGHVYFYFEDVLPRIMGGRRYLRAPALLKRLFGEAPAEAPLIVVPPPPPPAGIALPAGVPGAGAPAPAPEPAGGAADQGHAHVE